MHHLNINRVALRHLLAAALLVALSSCSLQKRVTLISGGADPYQQANPTDRELKLLHMSSGDKTATVTLSPPQ